MKHHDKSERATWGSSVGFLLAAIGSAVGLGNIWGFPYKMGENGGFAFLVVYILLVLTVGVVIMSLELALGRRTGQGVVGAYRTLGKKYAVIGWMGYLVPLIVMGFYSVLGGYCLKYTVGNLGVLLGGSIGDSVGYFNELLNNPGESVFYTIVCLLMAVAIVLAGVDKGIERFSKIAMPALFVMLVIVIVRSVTLDGAADGLAFMFKPDLEAFRELGLINLLSTAGGQMFFSLSLGMGTMITYGSYLPKQESIAKNAVVISIADTMVAIMAGLAVMPAVFATMAKTGDTSLLTSGPSLLFVSLQTVFHEMGAWGGIFGFLFYALVLIAAVTSMVSLLEALAAYFVDRQVAQGKPVSRAKIMAVVSATIAVMAVVVAADGLGASGMWVPLGMDCWLTFLNTITENVLMPLGALLGALLFGWVIGPQYILDEMEAHGAHLGVKKAFVFCLRYIVPVIMLLVLGGMLVQIPAMIGVG